MKSTEVDVAASQITIMVGIALRSRTDAVALP